MVTGKRQIDDFSKQELNGLKLYKLILADESGVKLIVLV